MHHRGDVQLAGRGTALERVHAEITELCGIGHFTCAAGIQNDQKNALHFGICSFFVVIEIEKRKKIRGQNSEALFYASEFFRLLFQFDGRFERDLHHLREGRLALLGGQGLAR